MGWQRYAIVPPFTQAGLISLGQLRKAKGASTETPQQSLETVGRIPINVVSFDLGVTDGWIDVKGKSIHFAGKGEGTNVGSRIESPTKGIDIDRDIIDDGFPEISRGVSRTKVAKKKTKKKVRRSDDISDLTSFSGIKYL